MQHKTVVLGTGGTIAGLSQTGGGYVAGSLGLAALLPPAWAQDVEHVDVCQIDSKDMGLTHWRALLQATLAALARDEVGAVLITHGTDTMEETAWLLHVLVRHASKPVVLTGAMRPADHASADGPGNLRDALTLARHPGARGRGVLVLMDGEVHAARHVRKVHAWAVHAFSSGQAGAVGWVRDGQVTWQQAHQPEAVPRQVSTQVLTWEALERGELSAQQQQHVQAAVLSQPWPWVEMLSSGAEAPGRSVHVLLAAGLQGLVVVATGAGSVHQGLEQALAASKLAVPVVLCTATELSGMQPQAARHWLGSSSLNARKTRLSLALWCLVQPTP